MLDAFTKEPVEKAVVVLYEENSDTAFTTKKPNYISFCDKKGAFSFSNVKAANFSIYAITDNNQNYYYDQKTESIAFGAHSQSIYGYIKINRLDAFKGAFTFKNN